MTKINLVVKATGKSVTLPDRLITVGRDKTCNLTISDGSVSRKHFSIEPDGDGVNVISLSKTQKTKVDGKDLGEGDGAHVKHRQIIQAGRIKLIVQVNDEALPEETTSDPDIRDTALGIAIAQREKEKQESKPKEPATPGDDDKGDEIRLAEEV